MNPNPPPCETAAARAPPAAPAIGLHTTGTRMDNNRVNPVCIFRPKSGENERDDSFFGHLASIFNASESFAAYTIDARLNFAQSDSQKYKNRPPKPRIRPHRPTVAFSLAIYTCMTSGEVLKTNSLMYTRQNLEWTTEGKITYPMRAIE